MATNRQLLLAVIASGTVFDCCTLDRPSVKTIRILSSPSLRKKKQLFIFVPELRLVLTKTTFCTIPTKGLQTRDSSFLTFCSLGYHISVAF